MLSQRIHEESIRIGANPCQWHDYAIEWQRRSVRFLVDDRLLLTARTPPVPPLAIVIWIDNQYAAFDPQGRITWGVEILAGLAWLEVDNVRCEAEPDFA